MLLFAACETDSYDKGDGTLSYYRADMVEMHVSNRSITSIKTDASETLSLPQGLKVGEDLEHPDTTYRLMLYYNKVEGYPIDIMAYDWVSVITPIAPGDDALTMATDPMNVAGWMSENGKYLNFTLSVKTGKADDKHIIEVTEDALDTDNDGTPHHYITLRHSQNDIPEYYTGVVHVSIPLSPYGKGEKITVSATTYSGKYTDTFTVK